MSSITEEIQQLQLRILELEKLELEKNENYKKTSIDYNFKVINDVLANTKNEIKNYDHNKSPLLVKFYNRSLVTHLEAIYNILQNIDERLKKLEEK